MLLPTAAAAQTTGAAAQTTGNLETLTDVRQSAALSAHQSPDLDVRTGFAGSGVQIVTGSDASNVMVTLSRNWDSSSGGNANFNSGSLVLTAPIDNKDRKEGAFLTEGGLPNSYSVQLSLARTWVPAETPLPASLEVRRSIFHAARERCVSAALTANARTACATADADDLMGHISQSERKQLRDSFLDQPLYRVGISGTVGQREFQFRQLADFSKASTRRTEFSVSAFAGLSPGSVAAYLGIGYEYRRQYKDVAAQTLCPTPATGAVQECFTAPFGEPTRQVDSTIFGVVRWQGQFSLGGGTAVPLGLEIRAGYDTRDDIFGVSIPVYFLSDGNGLRGGVRLDWQDVEDKDERFGLRVFVGTSFNLFGG
ncbi:hypothetical protein [Allosphingosinicella sp.]|jgi:hypothetical protein|uniref:hypothetical protein n=1 Tax=Allosphingosinicella sp. TaxID=2823234 RepID=UPI002EFE3E3E